MLSAVPTSAERFYQLLSSPKAVQGLVGRSEDADFDCKEWPVRMDDARRIIAKAACGFTNATGGVIVIGVKASGAGANTPDVVRALRKGEDRSQGLVFQSPVTGGCYYSGIIQRKILKPKGEEIGIVGLGWHTFRHTYRSLLDEMGAIGVQQKLMRHANVATTMNVYGRATLRAKQQANSKVVQMVMSKEKPPTGEELAA